MKGFYTPQDIKSDITPNKPTSCASCGLYKTCKNPRMKPFGKFKKKIFFIGEAPGDTEDRRGKPWQGRIGKMLDITLKEFGIDLFKDGIAANSCFCRPPKNRTPTPMELYSCRPKLIKEIKEKKPNIIFLFGPTAINSVIGRNFSKKIGGVDKWRGWIIPDQELNAWICPVFHPSFVIRSEEKNGQNLAEIIWKRDVEKALKFINIPVPRINPDKYVIPVNSDAHFKKVYYQIMKADLMAFDYEGTGLKPHAKGHQITTVSACISPVKSYVWMNNPYRAKLFKKVLENKKIRKISHNLPFENMWSDTILKAKVKNWYWDTLVNNHIVDNRPGINSLKFITYVMFGIGDYDSLINPYLKSPDKEGSNAFNKILQFIKEYGTEEIMKYCGLDSLFCFWAFLKQAESMGFTDETIHMPVCPFKS